MEFWIGIIFGYDLPCHRPFHGDQPEGICKRHEVSVGTTDKIFRIVGIIAVIILVISLTSRVLTLV